MGEDIEVIVAEAGKLPGVTDAEEKKTGGRALVMSGGGSHGAYQVGVLKHLIEQGRSWRVVAGVSVGALNGALLAQYSQADTKAASTHLQAIWDGISGNRDIYRPWLLGRLAALWKGGMYDTTPLEGLVRRHFDPKRLLTSDVLLRIGAVGFGSGKYRYVTEKDTDLPAWIMASSAFQMAFPPKYIDGEAWMDGGICDCTPVRDVLAEKPDAIDVVMTFPKDGDLGPADPKKATNIIELGMRSVAIMFNEVLLNDLAAIPEEDRSKITIYAPSSPLDNSSLDFAPEWIAKNIARGYADAAPR